MLSILGFCEIREIGRPFEPTNQLQMSNEKRAPGWLGYMLIFQGVGDEILPSYVVIIVNHYQDPYSTTSILECHTPPKFNLEPEYDGFQKESPFPGTSFQVPC